MLTREEIIKESWYRLAGKKLPKKTKLLPSLKEIKKIQYIPEFEQLMRNRLIMGAFRYGLTSEQDFSGYDLPGEAIKRINKYIKDKNLEHLVDAGNMLALEFRDKKNKGFKIGVIDDGEHAEWKE